MPAGAIISPPESLNNSSDDDDDSSRGRRRDQSEEIEQLSAAVHRSLDVRRHPSPTGEDDSRSDNLRLSIPNPEPKDSPLVHPTAPLAQSARKISHSRSSTDSAIPFRATPHSSSDESDDDEDSVSKPPLLRKKSGELVKPALRPPSRRRPSSMPGTPTYAKAVHFNDDIEQVRHFLQVDRPIAVSAGSSPVDPYDDECEFPFGADDEPRAAEWEIRLLNFPRENYERMAQPVRVDRIFLSSDNKMLIGVVAVANLSFRKHVVTRFTFDYWKTTSEIVAEYNYDVRQKPRHDGYDQFNFNIKLADLANLEKKTMLLCVRYSVNGHEYWDNNKNMNYSVDFAKKQKPKPEKPVPQQGLGARPLGAIPRSRRGGSASAGRPHSIASIDDDFARSFDDSTPGIRLKNPGVNRQFLPDAPPRRPQPHGQPFGSRYDFGTSLSAALSQAQATLGGQSGLGNAKPAPPAGSTIAPRSGPIGSSKSGRDSPRPDALLADSKSLDSRAYQEFVSKFCFFGSAKTASQPPSKAGPLPATGDGAQDGSLSVPVSGAHSSSDSNTPTYASSSPENCSTAYKVSSPNNSRSTSPAPMTGTILAERPASPAAFGYPYHANLQAGMQAPTAIQG